MNTLPQPLAPVLVLRIPLVLSSSSKPYLGLLVINLYICIFLVSCCPPLFFFENGLPLVRVYGHHGGPYYSPTPIASCSCFSSSCLALSFISGCILFPWVLLCSQRSSTIGFDGLFSKLFRLLFAFCAYGGVLAYGCL